ncbi:MAG TPA: hypothetical protein VK177_02635 [Flavobacteriales bacterium]|nr:hypothetical protein [Flavobacteriales bacterium]
MDLSERYKLKLVSNADEISKTIGFLDKVLSHRMNEDIWNWEFGLKPHNMVMSIIYDEQESAVVGSQFMLPIYLVIQNSKILTGKSENSHADPALRGTGLFEKLYAKAVEDSVQKNLTCLWGFTPALKVFEKKLGFLVDPGAMYNFSIAIGKPSLAELSKKESFPKYIARYFYNSKKHRKYKSVRAILEKNIDYLNEISNIKISNQPVNWNDLHFLYEELKIANGDFVHLDMNQQYVEWRILKNPNLSYTTTFFYKSNVLIGYYVFSISNRSASLADFTGLNQHVLELMYIHLLKTLEEKSAVVLNYFGNRNNKVNAKNFALFEKLGGLTQPNPGMAFVYRDLLKGETNADYLSQTNNWYLNGLWTEGFTY